MSMSEAGKLGAQKALITIKERKLKRIEDYLLSPSLCETCCHELDYKHRHNRFCGHSCAAKFSNIKRATSKDYICNNCEKKFHSFSKLPLHCSQKCYFDFKFKENLKKAANNEILGVTILKKILLHLNPKCNICDIDTWNDKVLGLEIDHVDGNSGNNILSNTRLLCPNCHSQTDNYKAKNAGNGRHSRRIRYQEGKSY